MSFVSTADFGKSLAGLVVGLIGAALAASPASAARFDAANIELRDITGEVRIVTNGGDAVDVVIKQGDIHQPIRVELVDGTVVLSGERWKDDVDRDFRNHVITRTISTKSARQNARAERYDDAFFKRHPVIEITMPRKGDATIYDARIRLEMDGLDGALDLDASYVFGETGDLGQAFIGLVDGSRLVSGNVAAKLEADISGAAAYRVGDVAIADVDIAGNGEVTLGVVEGMLDVSIAGSGLTRVARAEGPVTARIAGSGDLRVQSGLADPLKVFIDGSGRVYFEGPVGNADLRLFGSSEVSLQSVRGRLEHAGSGPVYVGGQVRSKGLTSRIRDR